VAQAHEVLARLTDLMPDDRRAIIELKAQGLSSRDVGDRLGISERTVQRVIEDLRRRIEPNGPKAGSAGSGASPDGGPADGTLPEV
jgi:RNA polymerase sigma-70 factor (ECF subfamily)